ncbi:MAG: ethanolamine ammonia-lyase subunit EutB, partial [Deltaproteobacteria bacterium]|nr:ethanolamine ammonia-lyase subunit EutB [Deltaproteobacteria bacterium]
MRRAIGKLLTISIACFAIISMATYCGAITIKDVKPDEDVFQYVQRVKGQFDQRLYQQVIGAANPYKEGDEAIGVSADDQVTRYLARRLLANTKIKDLHEKPLFEDNLQKLLWGSIDKAQYEKVKGWTMAELKEFLMTKPEADIRGIMFGLNSDIVGCVTKICSNPELCVVGQKVFNPLPGSKLGAKGYMSARIQPNSPTDDPEDIVWQVFDAWCYATGDLVIGTNPVSDSVDNILKIQEALRDVVVVFGLDETIPWCVLAHIDKQYECEKRSAGSTTFWFQSLAGVDDANQVFDVSIEKMMNYAKMRKGKYGLYHETGQGADYTNGQGKGFDMVCHESRKYGFSRVLRQEVAKLKGSDNILDAWCHTNDVAGFIGPEIFKTREQLVRCCLEDIVMGKLQGVCLGLDICSTLHMPVTLDDLNWCQDEIMPGNPAYLMALPTKNDPMLSYLTTGYQDHVRCRAKFGYKVNDAVSDFFKKIKIIDAKGNPTEHFGDPVWVYYQYRLAKGDKASKEEVYADGKAAIKRCEDRGVPIAKGVGKNPWDMDPELAQKIKSLYDDARVSLWAEFTPEYVKTIPNAMVIATQSGDREEYIANPSTGEALSKEAVASLEKLRDAWGGKVPDVQIAISDGLNAKAIMDKGHLEPYLNTLRKELEAAGFTVGEKNILVKNGRVRAGYAMGDIL